MELSQEAKEARNAYMRQWRANNKRRTAEYNNNYWERQSAKHKKNGTNSFTTKGGY